MSDYSELIKQFKLATAHYNSIMTYKIGLELCDAAEALQQRVEGLEADLLRAEQHFHVSVDAQDAALTSQINHNAAIAKKALIERDALQRRVRELETENEDLQDDANWCSQVHPEPRR